MNLLDQAAKLDDNEQKKIAEAAGFDRDIFTRFRETSRKYEDIDSLRGSHDEKIERMQGLKSVLDMWDSFKVAGYQDWIDADFNIVRGLAYYTGMVFEVHEATGAERAIAGGGRYDNLIELFGGPPTPAVGFGMGDVVLSLVLQDKGLMPSDREIARSLGLRPDVFVITNGAPETDAMLAPLLARLRREGKHARRSYKSTKNIGKLLKDAADADARYAVIIESPTEITVKDMDANTQEKGPMEEMLGRIKP